MKGGKIPDIMKSEDLSMADKVTFAEPAQCCVNSDIIETVAIPQVCMITGANSGVGFEVAQFLAAKGATVVMVCRSPARAEEAKEAIVKATGSDKVSVLFCDCRLDPDNCQDVWCCKCVPI